MSPDLSRSMIALAIIVSTALVGLVSVVGGLLHARSKRLLTHAERMKALEMGREVPDDPATAKIKAEASSDRAQSFAARSFTVAGTACFWGFLFAVGAASRDGGNSPGAAYAIASAAGAVGVTGLICGTILATRPRSEAPAPVGSKVAYDAGEV